MGLKVGLRQESGLAFVGRDRRTQQAEQNGKDRDEHE
jgi:hypothetical protein